MLLPSRETRHIMMISRIWGVLLLLGLAAPGWSQGVNGLELGARAGVGFHAPPGGTREPMRTAAGMEVCLCPGRLGLFAEYTGFFPLPGNDFAKPAQVFGGGVRFQWGKGLREFLDIGAMGSLKRCGCSGQSQVKSGGFLFGTGATIALRKHAYVRPQFHLYAFSDGDVAMNVGASVGWRF